MALSTTWVISWTNPAGSSDGDVVIATIKTDPKRPGSESHTVPQGKVIIFKDLTKKNASIGGILEFVVNDTEIVYRTKDITGYDPANPSRPEVQPVVLYPGDTLKVNVYVNANTSADAVTETAELEVIIMDEEEFASLAGDEF